MYSNLIIAMKRKGITIGQIAELLNCRAATVSDKIHGKREYGFYLEEALRIKNVFFNEDGTEPDEKISWCSGCGQKLDWSNEE